MITASFHYPTREFILYIAPERKRGVRTYKDKGTRGGGVSRATDGDGIGTKQAKNGGKA